MSASRPAEAIERFVMGIAGYRFCDYARLGTPLAIICLIISAAITPRAFGT